MTDRVDDDRLAELRLRHSLVSSVDGREMASLLAELERRRALDGAPMKLQWKEQARGGWFGYSGGAVRAMVLQILGQTEWSWGIRGVSTKWVVQGDGKRKDLASARRAADAAWTKWCRDSGLVAAYGDGAIQE